MPTDREKKLTIRASEDEITMLQAVAEADGLTSSDVVRQFIRRAHAERFAPKPAKKGGKR